MAESLQVQSLLARSQTSVPVISDSSRNPVIDLQTIPKAVGHVPREALAAPGRLLPCSLPVQQKDLALATRH